MKVEYIAEKCNEYKDIDAKYYEDKMKEVLQQEEKIFFRIEKFTDSSRYYIRASDGTNKIFDKFLREIALPRITDLIIEKTGNDYNFKLELNFDEIKARNVDEGKNIKQEVDEEIDLSTRYNEYLTNVKNYSEITANKYVQILKQSVLSKFKLFDYDLNIYTISNLNEFKKIDSTIRYSSNYKDINNEDFSKSLKEYASFLEWIKKPHQRIFFGAPGTGKSYMLNKEAKEYFGNNYERVTFHPNYMYGNFVGAFKPYPKKTEKNGEIEETITYEYVEGILMRLLVKALSDSSTNYLLLIEEINRANVAAVFGDIFQLLDRDQNGESEYIIATSKDQRLFLEQANEEIGDDKLKNLLGNNFETLFLPSNFYIWATMNSADQGVMPMDTAFRRRWDFTYLGIDDAVKENEEDFKKYKIKISSNEIATWNDFRVAVNNKLASMNIPEDKFIGPFFISKSVLEASDISQLTEIVKNKVIMYLYEDVAKGRRNELFEENKYLTYSQACSNFDKDAKNLFKNGLDLKTTVINQEIDEDETSEANMTVE
ncbi:McrB family protein [Facklamia sp. P12955]|uniref:McrB family protein n=1 Tax=Facklamia sp. P12955 TaxID=3421946 RepID=UPI003D1735C6